MNANYAITIFTNDNNVEIKLPTEDYYAEYKINYYLIFHSRNNHEVMFRRLHTYFIKNKIIRGNIIDLGAWIGDNSIPWAMNIDKDNILYAIDPSPQNIKFINSVCKLNNISNIKTLECAVTNKNETVYTNDDINHLTINNQSSGVNVLSAVSLDFLYRINVLDNIGYIHLDVEGCESKVIEGADRLIHHFKPIISIEQHIETENYLQLMNHLISLGYNVYLINEILPGCKPDCRNFIAFPNELAIDIDEIHKYLGVPLLLSIGKTLYTNEIKVVGKVFGLAMSDNIFTNICGVKHVCKDLYLFAVHDGKYTKIIATTLDGKWVDGRYLFAYINLGCAKNISNAYDTANGVENRKEAYNISIQFQ